MVDEIELEEYCQSRQLSLQIAPNIPARPLPARAAQPTHF
jgi:hypothetical protein